MLLGGHVLSMQHKGTEVGVIYAVWFKLHELYWVGVYVIGACRLWPSVASSTAYVK